MNAGELLRLLKRHHGKRLLIDANLLLPYFQGCFYRMHRAVPPHASFKEEEFVLLAQIIDHFGEAAKILTTPHLLTEVSSVSKEMKEHRSAFLSFVRPLITQLDEQFNESKTGARRLCWQDYFPRFGLADAAIIRSAYDPILVLTNDQPMARYLQRQKRKQNVIYFGDLTEQFLPRI